MNAILSNETRALHAITALWVIIFVSILSIVSSYLQFNLLQEAITTGELNEESAIANDQRESIVGILYFLVFILSAIFFIRWFHRAYSNLHQKSEALSYTKGWAIGSWFVPILNLIRPYKIMKELFVEINKIISKTDNSIDNNPKNIGYVVGIWWGLWVTDNTLSQILIRIELNANHWDTLAVASIFSIFVYSLSIAGAYFAIKLIREYSVLEMHLNRISNIPSTTSE